MSALLHVHQQPAATFSDTSLILRFTVQRGNRRDCCCGGVVDGKGCLKIIGKAGNPPGLHSISKQGIPNETVDCALVRRFIINASVTLLRFYCFCAADLRCSGAFPARAELTLICSEQRVGEYIARMFVHFKVLEIIQTSIGSFSCVCVCDMNGRHTRATASPHTHHHVGVLLVFCSCG